MHEAHFNLKGPGVVSSIVGIKVWQYVNLGPMALKASILSLRLYCQDSHC